MRILVMSPDKSRVAVARGPAGARDIWIVDIARGSSHSPDVRFRKRRQPRMVARQHPTSRFPRIAQASDGCISSLLMAPATNGYSPFSWALPSSWSKYGRFLLFTSVGRTTVADLWALPDSRCVSGNGKPFVVLQTSFSELNAHFALAAAGLCTRRTNRRRRRDVRAFSPDGTAGPAGAKWLISRLGRNGAVHWHSYGNRLLSVNGTTFDPMAVDIDTSKGFQAGTPRPLFRAPAPFLSVNWSFGPDAQRYLFVTTPDGGKPTPFTVVLNWAAALEVTDYRLDISP